MSNKNSIQKINGDNVVDGFLTTSKFFNLEKFDPSNVNQDTAIDKLEERKLYKNQTFNSLPSRGLMKNKEHCTKPVINSDIFFQSKTLLYADHQRPSNLYPHRILRNTKAYTFPSNSMDSLNSVTDPEIVAALDQIASKLGLIDDKVAQISVDPVNYLLKTRSFSDKLLIHKNSPKNTNPERRVKSLVNETESIFVKTDMKSQSQPSTTILLRKKENSFRKIIQKFSPKGMRRTKSTPPTIINNSKFANNSNGEKTVENDIKDVEKDKFTEKSCSNEIDKPHSEGIVRELSNFDINSKRLLQSISIDRVEDPKSRFHRKTKDRLYQNMPPNNQSSYPLAHSLNIETNQSRDLLQSIQPLKGTLIMTPSKASYIRISLSAFGYGPDPTLRRSNYCQRSENVMNGSRQVFEKPHDPGDEYCPNEDSVNA